jgi:PhnB protein
MSNVQPIPAGYHTLTPYLIVDDAAAALEFYKSAFGASELLRMPGRDGKIGHAELRIGDSVVMLADESPQIKAFSPKTIGGSPITLHLYVDDVDAWIDRAIAAGANLTRPVATQFYGDRTGGISDPFGYSWYLATHVEDVSPEEMEHRAKAAAG